MANRDSQLNCKLCRRGIFDAKKALWVQPKGKPIRRHYMRKECWKAVVEKRLDPFDPFPPIRSCPACKSIDATGNKCPHCGTNIE